MSVGGQNQDFIGIVPAAGLASRIAPVPCSKEIYPIALGDGTDQGIVRPKVSGQYLLEKFSSAHVAQALMILRKGKWDIPQYFGNGLSIGIDLAYLIVENHNGVPFTVDQAYFFIEHKKVAFGFPDILFSEQHAFDLLIQRQRNSEADVVLGLFPCGGVLQADRVDVEEDGSVRKILVRSTSTPSMTTWGIAVWTPQFTNFLHDFLAPLKDIEHLDAELSLSKVLQAGLERGLNIQGITVSHRPFLDIGTPEGLAKASAYS